MNAKPYWFKIKRFTIQSCTILSLFFSSQICFAAGEKITFPKLDWSFSGITGTFDRASQQRGLQVYKEVCAGCHGMRLLAYRNLKAIGYNDNEIKAFASENSVNTLNDDGEVVEREARPSDGEILTMRLVDRVLRPLFPKDYHSEVQVMIQLMSHD